MDELALLRELRDSALLLEVWLETSRKHLPAAYYEVRSAMTEIFDSLIHCWEDQELDVATTDCVDPLDDVSVSTEGLL